MQITTTNSVKLNDIISEAEFSKAMLELESFRTSLFDILSIKFESNILTMQIKLESGSTIRKIFKARKEVDHALIENAIM